MANPPAIPRISVRTMPSRMRKRCCCRNSTMSTSSAVMSTPTTSGMPKSRCSATAEPMTSARSQAAMAISASTQSDDGRRLRVVRAAGLGQVVARADAQAHGERLQQDRHQVRQHDHAEQRVAEPGAAGEVGGPVARVHVADRDEVARAGKREQLAPEARRRRDRHRPVRLGQALLRWWFAHHGASLHQAGRGAPGLGTRAGSSSPGCVIIRLRAPVAQLDRAPDFESVGRRFESCRARQPSRRSGWASVLPPLWLGRPVSSQFVMRP